MPSILYILMQNLTNKSYGIILKMRISNLIDHK